MFLFPLSYSRPFFSKPPILNKDLHIFVSAEFWRGDRMLFICPGALKNKSRGQRLASGRGEETRLWIKVFAKINEVLRSGQVSRVLFGWWEAFFGVQERYFWMFDLGYYPILSHLDQGWRSLSLGFESTMPSSRTQTNPKKGVQHLFIEDMCENPPRLFVWFSFHFTAIEQVSFPQPRRSEIVPSPIVLRAEQEIRYSSTDIGNFMCVFPQTILSVSLL